MRSLTKFRGGGIVPMLMIALLVFPPSSVVRGQRNKLSPPQKGAVEQKGGMPIEVFDTSVIPAPSFGPLGRFMTRQNFVPQAASEITEREPNNTTANATPLTGTQHRINGNLFPNGDVDYFSFSATAGDKVFAAVMTSFSAGSSTDSQLTLLGPDGTTVIEFDEDNGTFAGLSSSIAGATIPATGTYYLKQNDFTAGTSSERPYELWFSVESSAPVAETEPNDSSATANPLPASGFVSGSRNPAVAAETDWYSFSLNAGDTVYLSLDLDPERDLVTWNGRLGFGLFGDASNQVLVVDDAGTGDAAPNPNRPSEAMFVTVKDAGTYYAYVDSATASVGGPTATYNLKVTVLPRNTTGQTCTTYQSTDVPKTIGPGTGLVSSTITVPGNPRIASMRVGIDLNHAVMGEIDASLRSPAGNDNGIFTDIGAATVGGQAQMNLFFDDRAAIPPAFTVLKGLVIKPELNYRLGWLTGEDAGGVWSLDLRDDTAGANGGTLNNWSLEICTAPPVSAAIVYQENFEPLPPLNGKLAPQAGDGGFTHSGTADEWQYGVPNTPATTTANPVAAFTTCNNGSAGCWKTDLTGTYNVSSNQDLFSPNINLTSYTQLVQLEWAMKYQLESASFDHAFVEVQDVNNAANNRIVWQFLDATMTNPPGNPAVNIPATAGWANFSSNISDFGGKTIRLRFHLDSDTTVVFSGVAIDDVVVKANAFTAAHVGVGGRVVNSAGFAIPRAIVTIVGADGVARSARTNSFGYYRFNDVEVDVNYLMTATAKGYAFAPRIVSVQDEIVDADFVGLE